MNNLTLRIITAILGAGIMIGGFLWNEITLVLVLFILSLLIYIEYLNTTRHLKDGKIYYPEIILNLITAILLFISFSWPAGFPYIRLDYFRIAIFPAFFLQFVVEIFSKRKSPFQNIGLNIAGLFYCILPFLMLSFIAGYIAGVYHPGMQTRISQHEIAGYFVLGYFLIVWCNDTFAYFTGKAIGKHKFFERISPSKTWEGFFGGMAGSLICAFILSRFFEFLPLTDWLAMGMIISIFGPLGDLVESMLKRSVSVKDSSSVLPGHGGFLDRFDATLLAAPMVFVYLMMRG